MSSVQTVSCPRITGGELLCEQMRYTVRAENGEMRSQRVRTWEGREAGARLLLMSPVPSGGSPSFIKGQFPRILPLNVPSGKPLKTNP